MKDSKKILIIAGGTGGHVMPALAVAEFLRENHIQLHWIGTATGMEATWVPRAGIPISYIDIQGLRGKRWTSWLFAPWRLAKAFGQACRIILKEQPHAVLSMGGYVAGPGALAAWIMRKPVLIHEQNAVAGWTNRILATIASRIMVAFPGVFSTHPQKVRRTGNPIRQAILAVGADPHIRFQKQQSDGRPLNLLIVGGSQGALKLNEVIPKALLLIEPIKRPIIVHQTGKTHLKTTLENYEKCGIKAEVTDFIEDMAKAYEKADIVICRSGALTIAELTAVGVASILIPFPYAVDDHQTENAKYLSNQKAAFLLDQSELTPQTLQTLIMALIDNPKERLAMADACHQLAMPLATKNVAQNCLEMSHE